MRSSSRSASSGLPGLALASALAVALGACGDDGATPTVDAAVCPLPATPITCTAGDDTPCTAVCESSYCHNIDDCPGGWSCNNMGRCRPPG